MIKKRKGIWHDKKQPISSFPCGYCQCGCGKMTKLASETNHRTGSIKGEPLRFIHGHNKANWKEGKSWSGSARYKYTIIKNPDHHRAHNGYVSEHILIAEKVLGKLLPLGAVVHHRNKDTRDNKLDNLVICENQSYHNLLHRRERALKECGQPAWRKCPICKMYDNPINLKFNKDNGSFYHRECWNEYQKQRRAKK